jgi:hypothetical protein
MQQFFEKAPPEAREILRTPISELNLKIEGSPIERFIHQLYDELKAKGLEHFRPACYLTDEWGCPSEEPVIGVPFYLADRRVGAIEHAVNDLEDEHEVMMYLRHEAGHAFNYAYELYNTEEWRDLFGPFRRPYRERYRFVPFSRQFVRHIAGWYAQKHPDEDFAETFAVWLTPGSDWRKKYATWGAMRKLEYVDRIARDLGPQHPLRELGEIDISVEDMDATVEDFYRENAPDDGEEVENLALDSDLSDIFGTGGDSPAAELVARHRKTIVDKVNYWTGASRPLVKRLVDSIEARLSEQSLTAEPDRSAEQLIELTVYVATLAMSHLAQGKMIRSR